MLEFTALIHLQAAAQGEDCLNQVALRIRTNHITVNRRCSQCLHQHR